MWWRTDAFAGLLVVALVVLLHLGTDAVATLERRFYDFAVSSSSRQPSDRVAVIAIDDQSIANLGRWPWPRRVHARMVDLLSQAQAKVVVHSALFLEPQVDPGLVYIRQIREALLSLPDAPPPVVSVATLAQQAEAELDNDAALARSMQAAGNVLIPSVYALGTPLGRPDAALPPSAIRSTVADSAGFSVPAQSAQQPIAPLAEAASGIGHLNQMTDSDGAVRTEPLLVGYDGRAVPSLALLAASRTLNLSITELVPQAPQAVQLGQLRIGTDAQARMRPQFYPSQGGRPAFAQDSFFDVLSGKIPASKYTGKLVVIGATAAGVGNQFPAPGHGSLSAAEILAHTSSSILQEHFIVQPVWSLWVVLALVIAVAAYVALGVPRLTAGQAALSTGVLFVSLLVVEYALLVAASLWMPLVLAATVLLLGHLAVTTKRYLVTEAGKVRSDEESAETNRMMGLALQGQGQLDMAFDRFRRVPMGDALMDNLYNLALDFERKRQFNKAQAVYEHMAAHDRNYKDLATKLARARNLSETVILGGNGGAGGGTLLLDGGAVEKPMLGRYQVEKELGKGAMGVVYQGRDPKIGRVVAIKTMALSREFAGEELDDARARFFREAETAGRLQHQNIVTIFDAGEEHDLAYIAMEFLKGRDLVEYCKAPHLLPVVQVLGIVARVAQALSYAHAQQVVHRDIKPANIMYEPQSDTVKVTDFGIARISDSNKTKTGLVLGTPSYMSPEQLAGKHVDGRSDLFSLGVMLYQMLTGVLPFRGDSMAELMFKISNEEPADLRTLRPELPERLSDIVQLALCKQPELRYQDGAQMAADLQRAIQAMQGQADPSPASPPAAVQADIERTVAFDATVPTNLGALTGASNP